MPSDKTSAGNFFEDCYYTGKIEQPDFGSATESPSSIVLPPSGKAAGIGVGLDGMTEKLAI